MQSYQKQKGPGTSNQSLLKLQNMFRKIPLLVIYYLTKFDEKISKITSANLCKPIHEIINYSTSVYPFVSRKCRKEERKIEKFEYLENENSFLDEIKTLVIVFEGLSFVEKIKI